MFLYHWKKLHTAKNIRFISSQMKMCGLISNVHNHVSVGDLYIPLIGPPILQQNWQIDHGNI